MMPRPIILVFFLVTTIVFSQQQHFELEWKDAVLYSSNKYTTTIPGFDASHMDYDEKNGLFYVTYWDENNSIDERSVQLANVRYETISQADLKDMKVASIPKKISYKVKSISARGIKSGYLKISPIVNENGMIKKIISFDLQYKISKSLGKKLLKPSKLALTSSVLKTGEWFRFFIDKTGVFGITPDFLSGLGINLSGIDPNTIKVYGNGGQALPLMNEENTEFDLRENAVQVIGGEDKQFSGNDIILFYGESTIGYSEDNDSHLNVYADKSYYYITYGGAESKRVQNLAQPSGAATLQINTFNDTQFFEEDLVTLTKSGRRWFGNKFDIRTQKSFPFVFPNLITTSPVNITVKFAAKGPATSSMRAELDNVLLGSLDFASTSYPNLAREGVIFKEVPLQKETATINLNYNQNGNPANEGYLDYIRVEATRALKGTGSQMAFEYKESATQTGIGQYNISDADKIAAIWDVTEPGTVFSVANTSAASSFSFKASLGALRKYHTVVPSNYFSPQADEDTRVSNQDIKGNIFNNAQGVFEDIDYLIITNGELLQSANRLADFHKEKNKLNVKVIPLENIYTEFSSGKQDIGAVRNLIRYVYENASVPEKRLQYVCLFGDASVDYKDRLKNNNNIVPVFETLESSDLGRSFATDDYYAMMDPNEGKIDGSGKLDLSVGRILADTPSLADMIVNKIIDYQSRKSFGSWRNKHLYVSDDVDQYWEKVIQSDLDILADKVNSLIPTSNVQKIYADAFRQESVAGGKRYPKVNDAILNAIESGVLVINYFGHGGEDGLASEFIYNRDSGPGLLNTNKYPLFITVTCNFTKFDNPERETAGELTFWNPKGGAVSMISTTRQITVGAGISINRELSNFLFPENEVYPTISQGLKDTKNDFSGIASRVVFYIGDPAMKLAIPERQVRLTKINDVEIGANAIDTLKALSRIKMSGEVMKLGALDTKYNGTLSTTIFDKEVSRTTLANDNTREDPGNKGEIVKLTFKELGGVIFKGKASVKNGLFEFEFIVPRDILIPVGNGRVSFYTENNEIEEDQSGRDETILIGGINENAPEDNTGPVVNLFLNDENFVSGGVVNNSPILIAKLQDENGINTSSGIGHDIIAILDGDETNPIILNDFYETALDDFTRGDLNFKLRDLEPGSHVLTVRAWDVYNNSSTQELHFIVLENEELAIENVLNYPNPLINYTEFWFSHNNPLEAILDVQIQLFTVTGKVIWTRNQSLSGKRTYKNDIIWDGRDNFGDRVGKGVYVYKISVKSTLTNKTVEKFEKLVVL